MDNTEDTAWVFDSLVGFLHGPVWNAPLQTFIEEKSLTFEPTDNGEIPSKPEYTKIHEEYKNLVDLMLGSYMEDIGITPEQFEAACQMSRDGGGLPLLFHQRLFEQIWAANDYAIFTRMMTQRNVELQIQALELIEQRSGSVPQSYQHSVDRKPEEDDQDAVIMEQVKKLSLEVADEPDPTEETPEELEPSIEDIHKEKQSLMSALDHFQKHVVLKESAEESAAENQKPAKQERKVEAKKLRESFKGIDSTSAVKPLKEDMEQRQQYLKLQRDKLLALKKQIREKQLAESIEDTSPLRPKSARNAKLVLSGDHVTSQDSSLQLRKALADRLRSEVVEKS